MKGIYGWNSNAIIDVSAITNLTALVYINLKYSPIESVLPFSNLTNLTQLYLNSMVAPSDEDVRIALKDSGISAGLSSGCFGINPKYEYLFTDIKPELDLSMSYLGYSINRDSSEFVNLYGRTNVTKLDLEGQTGLTDDDLQETLGSMTGLKFLRLRDTNLKSVDFVTGLTQLIELDLSNCTFDVDEVTSKVDLSELNGLSNLQTLVVSDTNINFSLIQSTINRLGSEKVVSGGLVANSNWRFSGLNLIGDLSLFNFTGCSSITRLYSACDYYKVLYADSGGVFQTGVLNLSQCSSLKDLYCRYFKGGVSLLSNRHF